MERGITRINTQHSFANPTTCRDANGIEMDCQEIDDLIDVFYSELGLTTNNFKRWTPEMGWH